MLAQPPHGGPHSAHASAKPQPLGKALLLMCSELAAGFSSLPGAGANIHFADSLFFLVVTHWAPGIAWCWQICRSRLHPVAFRERIHQKQNGSWQNSPVKFSSVDRGNLQPWLTTGCRAAIQVSHFILERNFSFQSLPKRSVLGLALQTVTLKGKQRNPWGSVWCEC